MTSKQDIEEFLLIVSKFVKTGKYDFINRDKYALTKLGITFKEAVYIVEHLQVENYYRGPNEDHNNKGNIIYEFGYDYDIGLQLYIKLTFRKSDELFIMSFHAAKREISYPYNKKEI